MTDENVARVMPYMPDDQVGKHLAIEHIVPEEIAEHLLDPSHWHAAFHAIHWGSAHTHASEGEPPRPLSAWDFPEGEESGNAQPVVWPQCDDPMCNTPYVFKRALSFTKGRYVWAWFRDCKHDKRSKKQPGTIAMTKDGPLPQGGE